MTVHSMATAATAHEGFDEQVDVAVVGGGPAGSTAAGLLARQGLRVLVLEREHHPRFHVGESLLPYSEPLWKRLGVWDQLRASSLQRKWGAAFVFEPSGVGNRVDFEQGIGGRHRMAFQVRRAQFDELLLRNAGRLGAEIREGWKVPAVLFEGERAVGVRAVDEQGVERRIGARLVVDASGRDCLVGRQLGLRRPDPVLRQAALFAHWEGPPLGLGKEGGDILVVGGPWGWFWLIPLDATTTSVGVVFPGKVLRERGGSTEDFYHELVGRSTTVSQLLASSRRVAPVRAAADFSYRLDRFAGDGWVVVGDAAAFLDPVFSSGILIGTGMAEKVADLAGPVLRGGRTLAARDFAGFEKHVRATLRRFRRFILAYYDPAFVEVFSGDPPLEMFRSAIVSILAGGVHDRDPRIWVGEKAFFLAMARERRLARRGKKTLPVAPAFDGNLPTPPTAAAARS